MRYTKQFKDKIIALYQEGKSTNYLQDKFVVNSSSICNWLREEYIFIRDKKPDTKVTLTCTFCKEKYKVQAHKKDTSKYCSKKCRDKSNTGNNNPRYKGKITLICKQCHKPFEVLPYMKDHEFCNRKCATDYSKGKRLKDPIFIKCKQCGKKKEIEGWRKGAAKFCNHKCYGIWVRGKNAPLWRGGINRESYTYEFSNSLKYKIRERDKFTCQLCDKTERKLKRKLSVHHIDYNKKNNDPENLISLCSCDHSKTNFNRNYFQNKFTRMRKACLKGKELTVRNI